MAPFSLKLRCRQTEIMDQPGLETARHSHALQGLSRLNAWSGSVAILWPAIANEFQSSPGKSIRLLDIATGAGDVPLGLWKRAVRAGWSLEIEAWDISSVALDFARRQAAAAGAPIRFEERDALCGPIERAYDIVISSLFLHHLSREQAITLLGRMGHAARRQVLVNDLVRSVPGYLLAWIATRLLTTSDIVHTDGPRSVASAFTAAEAVELAQAAGLGGAEVRRRWPFRFLLQWHKPHDSAHPVSASCRPT
jgi:2-polyprenyl-3-methyl-5-hydroxy-6-metoxy-1,4-benzoquinol methylase